jgi:anti-anti-sigma factor
VTLTALDASAGTVRTLRSVLTTPLVYADGTRTVIVLRGEADLSTRADLSDVLSRVIAHYGGDVVVDLAVVAFVDTAIVRVLAMSQRMLDGQRRSLTFRTPSRLAARMLDLFGMTEMIEAPERAKP